MILKIECINNNLYLDFESDVAAEETMLKYNGLLKNDEYILVKDDEYNCILYKKNILGMYVISDEAFHKEKYRKR
jgi:hypothetical protein